MNKIKHNKTPLEFKDIKIGTKFYDNEIGMVVEVEQIDDIHNVWASGTNKATGEQITSGAYCFDKECKEHYQDVYEVTTELTRDRV